MSTNQEETSTLQAAPTCMDSVNRIVKLPVVESTIQTATDIYSKVKEYNSVTNWIGETAEQTVNKAVEVGKPLATPVVKNLEGPIKKVDGILCTGLDYVESKVPAVKLPPGEIYNSTKEYVSTTVTPVVESAVSYAQPAMKTARDYVEPAVQQARSIVEPLVQPAVEKAQAIVGEFLHNHGENIECEECKHERKSEKTD